MSIATLPVAEISRRLEGVSERDIYNPFPTDFFNDSPRRAGILIPFTCIHGEWHLLFIRRTQNENDRHGGQVAFPGGRMDASDPDITFTALREAEEEVGLSPSDVQIVGRLYDFHSITNYTVTPVIGIFQWPYPLKIDPHEVSRVFTIPLAWVADPANYQITKRHLPQSRPWPIIYFDPYDGEALWGFTAQVVLQLIEVLSNKNLSE